MSETEIDMAKVAAVLGCDWHLNLWKSMEGNYVCRAVPIGPKEVNTPGAVRASTPEQALTRMANKILEEVL